MDLRALSDRPIRLISFGRDFMIPVESTVPTTPIEGFPSTIELRFDQLTDHVTVQKAILPSQGPYPFARSAGEELSFAHDIIDLDRAPFNEEDMNNDDTRYNVFKAFTYLEMNGL
jgi:hypothetical protein